MGTLGRAPFVSENPQQGFTPVGIPGCVLWLRADSVSGANGSSVASWADESGSGYSAAQGTASKQPTLRTNVLNGKPVLRFDGVDDFLSIADFACVCRIAVFVVAKFTVAKPMQIEQSATANSNPGFFFYGDLSGPVKIARAGGIGMSVAGTDDWMGASFASVNFNFTGTVTGSGTDLYRKNGAAGNNGTTGNTLGATDTTVTDTLYICSRAGTSAFSDGDLAEIIVYNNALTSAQVSAVEAYLNGKYAIY